MLPNMDLFLFLIFTILFVVINCVLFFVTMPTELFIISTILDMYFGIMMYNLWTQGNFKSNDFF